MLDLPISQEIQATPKTLRLDALIRYVLDGSAILLLVKKPFEKRLKIETLYAGLLKKLKSKTLFIDSLINKIADYIAVIENTQEIQKVPAG